MAGNRVLSDILQIETGRTYCLSGDTWREIMSNKLLKFVDLAQKTPEKRPADARRRDFDEIYRRFDPKAATEQASRCSQCGIPFCQVHCPVHNNIPDWLMLTAEGRLEEAYEVSSATNNLPEICGRICPQVFHNYERFRPRPRPPPFPFLWFEMLFSTNNETVSIHVGIFDRRPSSLPPRSRVRRRRDLDSSSDW